jgi:hypothetical protein
VVVRDDQDVLGHMTQDGQLTVEDAFASDLEVPFVESA